MTIYVRVKIRFHLYRIVTQVLLALRGKGKSPKQTSQLQPSKHPMYTLHNCLNFVPRLINRNDLISEMTMLKVHKNVLSPGDAGDVVFINN